MINKDFKELKRQATCTSRPWEHLIPRAKRFEVLRQVKQECLELYGQAFDECPKRLSCFSKNCIGRKLEWDSPTARPYLNKFAIIHNLEPGDEYFLDNCNTCEIKATCSSLCSQVNDFMNRAKVKEPELLYKEEILPIEVESTREALFSKELEIPWDCLTPQKQAIVKTYIYDQRDFAYIANKYNLWDQSKAKYQFYSALTKLSKFSTIRKFLNSNHKKLTEFQALIMHEIFINNNTASNIARKLNISKQAVGQVVAKIIKLNKIKWQVFVKKQGKRLVYNTARIITG